MDTLLDEDAFRLRSCVFRSADAISKAECTPCRSLLGLQAVAKYGCVACPRAFCFWCACNEAKMDFSEILYPHHVLCSSCAILPTFRRRIVYGEHLGAMLCFIPLEMPGERLQLRAVRVLKDVPAPCIACPGHAPPHLLATGRPLATAESEVTEVTDLDDFAVHEARREVANAYSCPCCDKGFAPLEKKE